MEGKKTNSEAQNKGQIRYLTNPFLDDMEPLPVGQKQVKISALGKDDNILVNQATGEINGTHVVTYKKVSKEKFVQLFTQNIALTFDLKAAGVKAFNVLMWAVQEKALGKDTVLMDMYTLEEFLEAHDDRDPPLKLSLPTFKRGLSELCKGQIIAKSIRKGFYFINPNFCFNGDKLAFTTVLELDKKNEKEENKIIEKEKNNE